ncbi:DUF721 domain-containing protein [Candidatus Peregrinibacteria bacterium]|jgi:hypothetical protein|nr:DUF721 domain-containing protein [Candidatus Peregrinibacteria bacterium]MBT4056454.1 DUF721 domain-containing protein [Candidatus Peregrinibacteria bacterium]
MTFTPLQNLMNKAAAKHGIIGEFKAIQACEAFNSMIPVLFPKIPSAKSQIKAKFYKDHTITIQVPSSAWASEIMMRKHQILEGVKENLPQTKGSPKIKDIKTKIFS